MGKLRWKVISPDPVAKTERRYSRDEVEALIEKAARVNGIDPASVRPSVDHLLLGKPKPVAKSAAQIERERVERQHALEGDMERDRAHRLRKSEQRRLDLERSRARSADVGRAAITFVDGRGETSHDAAGSVARLDLSQPVVKRQRRGLFGDIVEVDATEPFRG